MGIRFGLCPALALWTASAICSWGQGTFSVRFDQSSYMVQPGGAVSLGVLIDPVPSNGLFSYGMGVKFDPAAALLALAGIQVPDDLNYNGVLGPGALKGGADGFAGVKGTVNTAALPLSAYHGSLLATFILTDISKRVGGSYSVSLDFFRTLGPSETLFVDGQGRALDGQLGFGSAMIEVIPEPKILNLMLIGGCCWIWRPKQQQRGIV